MTRTCLISTATLLLAMQLACEAEAGCCARCGATCPTQLVCHTICTSRLEECICWGETCETVCMPPKSASWAGCTDDLPCDACAACDEDAPLLSAWSTLFSHTRRCHFRDRNKLMRRTLFQYVPTLECVVEELCAGCQATVTPTVTPAVSEAVADAPAHLPLAPVGLPATAVVPATPSAPALPSGPVRLQVSDQLQDATSPLPPVITASAEMMVDGPADEPALAPVVPVVHSLSR